MAETGDQPQVKKTVGNPADRFPGPGPGRPKGLLNRTSREAALQVLGSLTRRDEKAGGPGAFLDSLEPDLFVSLLRVILPKQIDSTLELMTPDGQPLRFVIGEVPKVDKIVAASEPPAGGEA